MCEGAGSAGRDGVLALGGVLKTATRASLEQSLCSVQIRPLEAEIMIYYLEQM